MSLLRPIIRSCVVGALRDQTWAGSMVFDTDMTPLAEAILGKATHPYIVVFTDVDDIPAVRGVAEVYDGDTRRLSILIEIGVASSVTDSSGNAVVKFSHTDFGMEWAVDVISRQALAALYGDAYSEWGTLFKRLTYKLHSLRTRRGGQAGGVRFAARRMTLTVSTNFDIAPGVVPDADHPVWQFITLARTHPAYGLVEVADTVEKLLNVATVPDWRQAQGLLGITPKMAHMLAVSGAPPDAPLDWTPTGDQAPPTDDIRIATPEEDAEWEED